MHLIIRFLFVKKYTYRTRRYVLVLHVVECIYSLLQLWNRSSWTHALTACKILIFYSTCKWDARQEHGKISPISNLQTESIFRHFAPPPFLLGWVIHKTFHTFSTQISTIKLLLFIVTNAPMPTQTFVIVEVTRDEMIRQRFAFGSAFIFYLFYVVYLSNTDYLLPLPHAQCYTWREAPRTPNKIEKKKTKDNSLISFQRRTKKSQRPLAHHS